MIGPIAFTAAAAARPLTAAPDNNDRALPAQIEPPALTLPKGGGAIRGLGEKFAANPVTGTGSMVVPIATSPGRAGFGPQLSLTYDSASGNGPFGFGWRLSAPAITRKTNKGLPRYADELRRPPTYRDTVERDTFVLSDAEDLVPVFRQDHDGTWVAAHPEYSRDHDGGWVRDQAGLIIHEDEREGWRIRRYRPRIEGSFARIEQWTNLSDPADVHWRTISNSNILSVYGGTVESRITDPADSRAIFSWLICETRDDKGNAIIYRYREEDGLNVHLELAHERNRGPRGDPRRKVNRYLKRIQYGNRVPMIDVNTGQRPSHLTQAQIDHANWMFEVIFDYGDHHPDTPTPEDPSELDARGIPLYPWPVRPDPFSTYRPGFESRTMRRCRRVLMFHHFPGTEQDGVGTSCLVRSTDFAYSDDIDPAGDGVDVNPRYSFLRHITTTGYRRDTQGGYHKASMPPTELDYSRPTVQHHVEDLPTDSLTNLPIGLDNSTYIWTDLHGEGIPGILTEQAGEWFYKRNLSPDPPPSDHPATAAFAPLQAVAGKPNTTLRGTATIMDLAGDGLPDVVVLDGPTPGLFEHDETSEGWTSFRPFNSRLNRDARDPNLRLVDVSGDGLADVLITEPDGFVWHESLAEEGFGPAHRSMAALDDENGPRVVFADATQSIFLADLSGDGLTDIVRICNEEVCYWPNLGYGRFGPKITMDHAPNFTVSRALDVPHRFDPKRVRLADIDGSGTADIIYLHPNGVRLYFNQSGNAWSRPHILDTFPAVDELDTITPVDLLGNGTACLVWSSPSPTETSRPMRYINLMGGQKPHLLVKAINNMGAETKVDYATSTKFYLRDKRLGTPWVTRLPFPVHVVARIETIDHVSRNRFTARYAYHHGYFDGEEREFRGFAMVEQWDTEEITALGGEPTVQGNWANDVPYSHLPPVHTKTWFHTGAPNQSDRALQRDYFRESGLTDQQSDAMLLPNTVLPAGLTVAEEREAARALKGCMLRREIFVDDAAPDAPISDIERAKRPHSVTEQSFGIRTLQRQGSNRHATFFTHPREAITYHYERSANDPRVKHVLTLDIDDYGNILTEAAIGYGRRHTDGTLPTDSDRNRQRLVHIAVTETAYTNPILEATAHRTPMRADARTYEVRKWRQDVSPNGPTQLRRFAEVGEIVAQAGDGAHDIDYEDLEFTRAQQQVNANPAEANKYFRRLVEHIRVLYRSNDLSRLLPLRQLQSQALTGETYLLAFTPGLIASTYRRSLPGAPDQPLLPNPSVTLGSQSGNGGGYQSSQQLKGTNRFPNTDPDNHWWRPSGRLYYGPGAPTAELAYARQHFYLARRFIDPFDNETLIDFDVNDLLISETRDALGNRVTADVNDYRVLQPRIVSDPNRNRAAAAFDTLGLCVGTAVMGKPTPAAAEGDSLATFVIDPSPAQTDQLMTHPRRAAGTSSEPTDVAHELLGSATTRTIYDVSRFYRSRLAHPTDRQRWQPVAVATIMRETHVSDLRAGQRSKLALRFSYADGFGREVQQKAQVDSGPLTETGPTINPRWVSTAWTVYNNKGKAVIRYEPYFTATHDFEFGVAAGVGTITFYDPMERVVATLFPNHTYEKMVFTGWRQDLFDTNDCSAPRNAQTGDPRTDPDIGGYVSKYFANHPDQAWQTWYARRIGGALGPLEKSAAEAAAAHADTPTTTHFDALGRPFLTVARNRIDCPGHEHHGSQASTYSRADYDIEGNLRATRDTIEQADDPLGRVVTRYFYDVLGNEIRSENMESGRRWALADVAGNVIRAWDARGHNFTTAYDRLRRPITETVRGNSAESDPRTLNRDVQVDNIEYGEPATPAQEQLAQRLNLRTRIYRHRDSAGIATNAGVDTNGNPVDAFDFKGNPITSTRRLLRDDAAVPDWAAAPQLDDETFTLTTRYDALNRPVQSIGPRSSVPRAKYTVVQNKYDDGGLLTSMDVWLDLINPPATYIDPATQPPAPVGVNTIDYNARGQRQRVEYRNGTSTDYIYEPATFRLARLYTRRGAGFNQDCDDPQPPPAGKPCGLQNLHYTYDPVGNITHIQDDAQPTIFFQNRRVQPHNDFTYDALYRLIQATGREHLGQINGAPRPPRPPAPLNTLPPPDHPGDGNAMGRYAERYVYDAAGNFEKVAHRGTDPQHAGWSRTYGFAETSSIENGVGGTLLKHSNRLSRSRPSTAASDEPHSFDPHGNTTYLQHLGGPAATANLHWDYKNRLRRVDLEGGSTVNYVYDGAGQRIRKVWRKTAGPSEEQIYLPTLAIYRRHRAAISATTAIFERETFHVTAGPQRIALIETRTVDTENHDPGPRQLTRYQLGNHIGSACLELDASSHVLSYEEYFPFGSTSYLAVRSQTQPPKRYRFTGKENDAETGLYYYGARYYAPWLGRWITPDPAGTADGPNLYVYVRNNPINFADPTGHLSWGQWAGIAAAVVIGTVVTVATAGLAGPIVGTTAAAIIGGIVGGAVGAGVGEALEAHIDDRESHILRAALIGGAIGGVFAGAGAAIGAIAKTAAAQSVISRVASSATAQVARSVVSRIASSAAGQAAQRAGARVAESAVGQTAKAGLSKVSGGLRAIHEGAERTGSKIAGRLEGTALESVLPAEQVPGVRPGRAAGVAEKFRERFGQRPESIDVVGSRAEAKATGAWPEGSGPETSDIDLYIGTNVPGIDKASGQGFEFFKDINPGKVRPGIAGIGPGPDKAYIGPGAGAIPKAGTIDPFFGQPGGADTTLGPVYRIWPTPITPPTGGVGAGATFFDGGRLNDPVVTPGVGVHF